MTADPFLTLVCDALGLMSRPLLDRSSLTPDQVPEPFRAAFRSRRLREAPVVWEFYHQFRKLWDRGIPVGMNLGHLLVRNGVTADIDRVPDLRGPADLCVYRMGEGGRPDHRLAAVSVLFADNTGAVAAAVDDLAWYPAALRFDHAVLVLLGRAGDEMPEPMPGVTVVRFDLDRWAAAVAG